MTSMPLTLSTIFESSISSGLFPIGSPARKAAGWTVTAALAAVTASASGLAVRRCARRQLFVGGVLGSCGLDQWLENLLVSL